jgi:hypothetical protein
MNTSETLASINVRCNEETALSQQQVFLNINPPFQREYESWDNKLKTRLVETMLIGRAINPIWVVFNDEEDTEEVLDGMHRLTTALNFLNNKFEIGKDLMELDISIFQGKYFKDLPSEQKNKIRNYHFAINKLDSSYKKDPQKLHDMYELLNRSSKTLNDFEFQKPLLQPFYELIQKYSKNFFESIIFRGKESKRGKIEEELGKCLAMSEYSVGNFSSINDMYKRWKARMFGQNGKITADGVKKGMVEYASHLSERLDRIKHVMTVYDSMNLFNHEKRSTIEYIVMINRSVALIQTNDRFSRNSAILCEKFSSFLGNAEKNQEKDEKNENRNSAFQAKLIEQIDGMINTVIDELKGPRLFSKEMINEKLNEQNNHCKLCNKPITSKQDYEGDHIIPWTSGGKTEKDNLQVVHSRCHRMK